MDMFCYQCEQTSKGTGCTTFGICGKDADTAALQDLVLQLAKEISFYTFKLGQHNVIFEDTNFITIDALFTTVTNVNFDPKRLEKLISEQIDLLSQVKAAYVHHCQEKGESPEHPAMTANVAPTDTLKALITIGLETTITNRNSTQGGDITGLHEMITYGLKGMAAYYYHAIMLEYSSKSLYIFFHKALAFLATHPSDIDALLAMALEVGEQNLEVMALLDQANTESYDHPVPTEVRLHPKAGKCILVSGHDLKDLEVLLEQTKDTGINIYTHGEMLPAHGYPKLKKYPHLVGNFGGAWMDQQKEFKNFPGPILMTTNCIQKPRPEYTERIFTCGLVAWPEIPHISDHDFSSIIASARIEPGFTEDGPDDTVTVGFGHNAVLNVAEPIIDAVKTGALKHFFLVGGCDGHGSPRKYFTEFANAVPDDCVILTLGCGKYRFYKDNFGDIGGIPRLLDMGQCNDAYSAIKVAVALADAFDTDVNGLPLSMVLSWFEQKAVCILLTLLHLGVEDIRIGPNLPAFITPNILNVLQKLFKLKLVTNAQDDLNTILNLDTTAVA